MSHPPGYYHLRQLPATPAFPQIHPTTSAHIHHHQQPPIPSFQFQFQFQTPSSYPWPAAPNNNTAHHYYIPSDSDFPLFASHSRIRKINPPIPPTPNSDHHHLPPSNSNDDHVRRLRDEVLYLHGLWHKGPPHPNSASIPTSTTTFTPPQQHSRLVKLSHPISFKKKSNKKRNNHKRSDDPLPVSDKEWPMLPQPPDPNTSSWPVLTPNPHPHRADPPVTEEEAASVRAMRIQQKGFNSFRDFMLKKSGSASSGSDYLESDTDDDDDCEDLKNCFSKTFQEDGELRGYYENNWENGHFRCLVCGGIRQKVGRKFKNLVALVQHSVSVSKTKKRKAHRIYGQAICNLLSWDISQLPSISENDGPAQNTVNSACNATTETISGAEKGANLVTILFITISWGTNPVTVRHDWTWVLN